MRSCTPHTTPHAPQPKATLLGSSHTPHVALMRSFCARVKSPMYLSVQRRPVPRSVPYHPSS